MEDTEIKVSVIIPVYNTEKYVREAVDSIRKQTLKELEIIVVNDGSTDGSLQILEEMKGEDERIRVYSQANQGQSVARNEGMKYAKGKYLYFMDSDDLLEQDALEICYSKCEEAALDFVCFDGISFYEENALSHEAPSSYTRTYVLKAPTYRGPEALEKQLTEYCFTPSPCLSFIRYSFLEKIALRFYPGIIHEDQLFTALLYLHASRVAAIPEAFFHRRMRKASTMTSKFSWKNMEGYFTVSSELLSFSDTATEDIRRIVRLYLSQMLNAAVWKAHILPYKERMRLAVICLRKYRHFIAARTYTVLLLKSVIHTD